MHVRGCMTMRMMDVILCCVTRAHVARGLPSRGTRGTALLPCLALCCRASVTVGRSILDSETAMP